MKQGDGGRGALGISKGEYGLAKYMEQVLYSPRSNCRNFDFVLRQMLKGAGEMNVMMLPVTIRGNAMSGKFSFFQNSAGLPAVAARFEDDNVWLTHQNLADLCHTTKSL